MDLGTVIESTCYVWMVSEIALIVFRRAKDTSDVRDAGSVIWLNVGIYGSLAVSLAFAFSGFGTVDFHRHVLAWIGLVLIVLGIIVRWTAILTLRRYFTVNVVIQANHQIVKSGIVQRQLLLPINDN